MEASLSSLIWYVSVMLLAVGFAYIGEHKKSVFKRRFYIGTAFLIILLFCSCRYYVGNDYGNYVYAFTRYRDWGNYSIFEPGFDFLYFLFGSSPVGYLWVFAIAACITYVFVFKALIREQSVAWGIYFLFTLNAITVISSFAFPKSLSIATCNIISAILSGESVCISSNIYFINFDDIIQ